MIRATRLSKQFGRFRAVSDVSFDVAPGEVVGLLGSNGAGKTTTLRMITGFLPPDAGAVSINGHDSLDASFRARTCVGYLPESAPAYGEMPVQDYLNYRGRLHGMGRRQRSAAVDRTLRDCDLTEVRRRRVGHLSRGYRQRVGLAAALLHDPPVLVLDEPTSALDPRQIRQIRNLIRELARTKAVLVSSHILPEVEQTCDRVIIMARGRVLAEGTPETLVSKVVQKPVYVVEAIGGDAGALDRALGAVTGVEPIRSERMQDGWVRARVQGRPASGDLREQLAAAAAGAGFRVRELSRERAGLERVFLELMEESGSAQEAA
jgi:ABC-2 type transport system ATP-binding protein